jgi:hypothetical protein
MNKCELLEKGGSIRKRGAVLVPAIFTQGIHIPAFLTLPAPKKISEPTYIDIRIAEVGEIETHLGAHQQPEANRKGLLRFRFPDWWTDTQ